MTEAQQNNLVANLARIKAQTYDYIEKHPDEFTECPNGHPVKKGGTHCYETSCKYS